jgi:hypothetical protein
VGVVEVVAVVEVEAVMEVAKFVENATGNHKSQITNRTTEKA